MVALAICSAPDAIAKIGEREIAPIEALDYEALETMEIKLLGKIEENEDIFNSIDDLEDFVYSELNDRDVEIYQIAQAREIGIWIAKEVAKEVIVREIVREVREATPRVIEAIDRFGERQSNAARAAMDRQYEANQRIIESQRNK